MSNQDITNSETFVVNSVAGDAINGKVYTSWAEANSAIISVYGEDWNDSPEPEAEIVPL